VEEVARTWFSKSAALRQPLCGVIIKFRTATKQLCATRSGGDGGVVAEKRTVRKVPTVATR